MISRFEHLPNELFLHLFSYFDIDNLYRSFWKLNQRINDLLRSVNNLSLIIERNDREWIEIFAPQISRLKIINFQSIDLSSFSNLYSLQLSRASDQQLEQIRSDLMPNLSILSITAPFHISLPWILIEEIFSNAFPSLQQVKLSRMNILPISFNSQSISLHSLRITCMDTTLIPQILIACPNLFSFHVLFIGQDHHTRPSVSSNHFLQEFTLDDSYHKLSFQTLTNLFVYIPNVTFLSLVCRCQRPLIDLIENMFDRLEYLNRFDCEILESPNNPMVSLEIIQEINPCLQNLQCLEKENHYRLFFTE